MTKPKPASRIEAPVRALPGKARVTTGIIENLREDIVTGRLQKGDRMPSEKTLAEQYGVSQPTVRETLRALEVIGLVDVRHGSGTYVSGDDRYAVAAALLTILQVSGATTAEVNAIRELLFLEAMRQAVSSATEEQIELIEQASDALDRISPEQDVHDIVEAYVTYLNTLSDASNSPLLATLSSVLTTLSLTLVFAQVNSRGTAFWLGRIDMLRATREQVVAAIKRRDPAVVDAGKKYFSTAYNALKSDNDIWNIKISDPVLADTLRHFQARYKR
ncbi:MAG: GntR family transcriptional regulator [Pseudoxanthomonas sp.]